MNYSYSSPRRRRRTGRFFFLKEPKILFYFSLVLLLFAVAGALGAAGLFVWYGRDLPRPDRVRRTEGFSTVIYDKNGVTLYDIYQKQNRVPADFADIPDYLKKAVIATEDKDFYKHEGYDIRGIGRALTSILFRRRLEGGSTLTQQLVKNVLLTQERTIPRKIKEFILSVQIESRYSKDEILQMYLNEAPYGGPNVGIQAASQAYFGRDVKNLSLSESVILAGLPASPSLYSPASGNLKAHIPRSAYVLRRMREENYISRGEEEKLNKELPEIKFKNQTSGNIKAPHFVFWIKEELTRRYGADQVENKGLKVTTSLDYDLQGEVEKIVSEELEKVRNLKVGNGAAVVLESKTGAVLAMVGSKDYFATEAGTFNATTQALRQPGSSIKPFTYAAAFKKGYTPAALIMDARTAYPKTFTGKEEYIPGNYDDKYRGPVQLRFALGNSINTVAVKLLALTGVKDMLSIAYAMGISTLEPTAENIKRFGLSVTLGGGEVRLIELTSAFSAFGTGGVRHEPYGITKVTDVSGKILWENKPGEGKKVLNADAAFLVSHILADNNARKEVFGQNSYLYVSDKTVAVKTGTTDDKRDNWTIGYTPSYAVGVWVGNSDNSPMHSSLASGVTGAAPVFNRMMKYILRGKTDEQFDIPENIKAMEIDALGGGLPVEGQAKRSEYFIKGTEPDSISSIYQKVKLSRSESGKLSNPVEIASGDYEEKDYLVLKENDPVSAGGKNRWQEAIDKWIDGQLNEKYKVPRETSGHKSEDVAVSVKEPRDKEKYTEHDIKISAKAVSLADIRKMELYVDGEKKKEYSESSFTEMLNFNDGIRKIKVRAEDSRGKSGESEITIGINTDPNPSPTP